MDLRTRIIISSSDQTQAGFNSARGSLANLERQINQARTALLGFFGVSLGTGLIKSLVNTADEYKNLNSAISLSTKTQTEFSQAQQELFNISQRTGTGLRENVDLFRRVNASVRDLGGSQARAFGVIDLIGKSVALSGVAAQTSAAGIQQFNQGLGSGVLRGEEFNSVMENTPRLAQALADGLNVTKGELRGLAEQGKLTSDVVLTALESQADVLNEEFTKVPLTVSRALVRLENAWTMMLGQVNETAGATATVTKGFNLLADHMREVVEAGLTLAKVIGAVYAAKIIQGVKNFIAVQVQAVLAQRQAAEAAAHEAIVQENALRVQVQATAVRKQAALAMLEEARLQRALASTEAERAIAQQALNRAVAAASLRSKEAAAAALLYRNSLDATTVAATRTERAMLAINAAVQLAFSFYIGKVVGEWLTQFEKVRQAGSYVAESFVLIQTGIQSLFNRATLQQRFAEIQRIHEDFNEIRANDTDAARQAAEQSANAENAKAEAVEASAERQQKAWKQVQEGIKELTGAIDADVGQQNTILQQRLSERLALIDQSQASELEKNAQRTQTLIDFSRNELQIAEGAANAKLQVIDQAYQGQLAKQKEGSTQAQELDRQSIEARKTIYGELASHYSKVIDRLGEEHRREVEAAQQTGQQIRDLAAQHEFELADIARQGVDQRKQIESEKSEFDQRLAEANAEIAKGQAGDQEKINALLGRARELSQDLGNATISLAQTDSEKSSARSGAAERLNKLYEAQTAALRNNEKAHTENAESLAEKQQEALSKLSDVNGKIAAITEQLEKSYALTISTDTTAIDAAIAKINSIPAEKIVVIRTVNEGGADLGAQSGGPIHGFSGGGWPRLQGRLSGYGGGDKIRSLLERGEWIIRKEAVRKIESTFGEGSMAAINQGRLPIQPVLLRASGGPADFSDATDREKQILANILANLRRISLKLNTAGFGQYDPRQAMRRIEPLLRSEGLLRFKDRLNELIPTLFLRVHSGIAGSGIGLSERQKRMNLDLEDQSKRLQAQLFGDQGSGQPSLKIPAPKLPPLSLPAPSLSSLPAGPASSQLLQAAQGVPDKTIRLEFQVPGMAPVSGQFAEKDIDKLFKTLKEAGLRTNGGHF
jgi:tape measure domain-containing protein